MNQAPNQLNNFKQKLDKHLDNYFNLKKREFKTVSPFLAEMAGHIHNYCKRGKRIRAALIYFSYLACGGKQKKMILELSSFVELIHGYFLIHDDIMDEDGIRRGMPTMHVKYKQLHRDRYKKGESRHFSNSMAIMAGDLAASLGYDILINSKINDKTKSQILSKINSVVINTIGGQIFDMDLEFRQSINRRSVLKAYQYKTAKYTIEGPLHIGAIAARKNNKGILNILSNYAIPLGIAFQIQDDILGIFGDEKKLGKPVGSDIREGKHTLLVWKAFAKANGAQKKMLKFCLGNNKLTKKQINDFRQVIIDTGALVYAKKEAKRLSEQALGVIDGAKLLPEGKNFLVGMAEYLINREY